MRRLKDIYKRYKLGRGDAYTYTPLKTATSFRILEILPGSAEDAKPLSFRLHEYDFEGSINVPAYDAISYVWGDPVGHKLAFCGDDHRRFYVLPNLETVLWRLRLPNRSKLVWADAICINQEDLDERSQQVALMFRIYSSANIVLIWLGEFHAQGKLAAEALKKIAALKVYGPDPFNGDEMLWRAIKTLFSQPWFSRIWVVQEIYAARRIGVLLGSSLLDVKGLFNMARHIMHWEEEERKGHDGERIYSKYNFADSNVEKALTIFEKWDAPRNSQGRLLYLASFRGFGATDPRDKIFALLALGPFSPNSEMPNSWISIDYKTSLEDLYRKVAERILLTGEPRNLEIFSHVLGNENESNSSSWAPRWDEPGPDDNFAGLMMDCSKGLPVSIEKSPTREHALDIAGIQVDVVTAVVAVDFKTWFWPVENKMKTSPFLDFLKKQKRSTASDFRYPISGQSLEEAICRLFTGNHGEDDPDDIHSFPEWLTYLEQMYGANSMTILRSSPKSSMSFDRWRIEREHGPEWETKVSSTWAKVLRSKLNLAHGNCFLLGARDFPAPSKNRNFFKTQQGFFGFGPKAVREGDVVCVLGGGEVPYLLRPSKLANMHRLVGECWVYGIMMGEAVKMKTESDVQTFHII